jgi:hypothetical protein
MPSVVAAAVIGGRHEGNLPLKTAAATLAIAMI